MINLYIQIINYDDTTGIYSDDDVLLNVAIGKFQEELVSNDKMDFKFYDFHGDYHKRRTMIKLLPEVCRVENFFDYDRIKTGFGKLLFKDGVYDIETDTFIDSFDCKYTFFHRINRTKPERNEEIMKELEQKLFKDPYIDEDHGLRLKQIIALAIHGGHLN